MMKDKKFLLLLLAVAVVITLEILSVVGIELPMPWAPILFGGFVLAVGWEVLWKGLKALVILRFSSINLLMVIAVVGAFYLGEYEEAAVVIVLFALGERLESFGIQSSKSALQALVDRTPKTTLIRRENSEIETKI